MTDNILEDAINLIKVGMIEQGEKYLVEFLQRDPENIKAWIRLYRRARTDEQRILCLDAILKINPDHQIIKTGLKQVIFVNNEKPTIVAKQELCADEIPPINNIPSENKADLAVSPNTEMDLENAINFLRAEMVERYETNLFKLLEKDPVNIKTWGLLYECVKTYQQKFLCLKSILLLKPSSLKAQTELELLLHKYQAGSLAELNNILFAKQENSTSFASQDSGADDKHLNDNSPSVNKLNSSDSTKNKVTIKIPFTPPTYIYNDPTENLFSPQNTLLSNFPESSSGMFGSRLFIGGTSISPYDHPKCVDAGYALHKSKCYVCEFFAESDCPLLKDPELLKDSKTLFTITKRSWQSNTEEYYATRNTAIKAIHFELKAHGRPLHYEVITKIMHDRYPELHLSNTAILHLMNRHSEKFEWIDQGVYRAK